MSEDELQRWLQQQKEQQKELERLTELFRGPLEAARQLQGNADEVARAIAPLNAQREQLGQFFATADLAERAFAVAPGAAAAAEALAKSEELSRALTAASEPMRAVAEAGRAQEALLRGGLPSQEEIDRLVNLVRREWAKFAPLNDASYWALFAAAASAAEAVDAEGEIVADDAEQTTARFLARARGLTGKTRAALVGALLEGALALLDAGSRLAERPDATAASLASIEIAVALAFIAFTLASLDGE